MIFSDLHGSPLVRPLPAPVAYALLPAAAHDQHGYDSSTCRNRKKKVNGW